MNTHRIASAALLGIALAANTVRAETISWINPASSSWNLAANWSPATIPGAGDTAIINQPGVTVSLAETTEVGSIFLGTNGGATVTLSLNGEELALDGTLTVNASGSFTVTGTLAGNSSAAELDGAIGWTAGDLAGTLTLAPACTFTIDGGAGNNDMPNVTLTNNGTVNWVSGTLRGGSDPGTMIYNNGLWDCQSDQIFADVFGGDGVVFNNTGTFRKSGGAGEFAASTTLQGGVVFNQLAGVIDVQNGPANAGLQLDFQGGGNLNGGYITTNQFGLTVLSIGNFNINGTVTGTNTWEDAGNLVGVNVINGALLWSNGVWNGATSVTITPNSTLLVEGGVGNNDMENTTVTNNGTVEWVSGTLRGGGDPGTFVYNNALWDCQSDQSFNDAFGGDGVVFNNAGTFRKSGGAGEFAASTTLDGGVLFNQLAGVIDVQNGPGNIGLQLDFQGGGNLSGGYITTNQFGLTVLSIGNFNINGTVTGTNTWEDGGNLVGNNVIVGALTWKAGTWNGATSVTIPQNTTLYLDANPSVTLDMPNILLTNNGTVEWLNGAVRGGSDPGTIVYNTGLWDCQSDQIFNNDFGGDGVVFNNTGIFRKSGGAGEFVGTTTIAQGVFFNQLAGVIDVQNGTSGLQLDFQGGANLSGGYVTTNQFGLIVLSIGNFNINGTVLSTNTWEDAGNLVGDNVIIGALTWKAGTWNGATSVTITPNTTLYLDANPSVTLDMPNVLVTNNGTVAWLNGAVRGGSDPGTFIYNHGLWDCQSDQILNDDFGGDGTVFNNTGIFRKSGGASEFTNDTLIANGVLFNQLAGVIDVQNGTNGLLLAFQGGANLSGGYVTTNQSGLVVLSEGNFNINGTVLSTNTWEDSGNLVGNNVIIGALTWKAGTWSGATSVTITPNTTLYLDANPSVTLDMPNVLVTNNGTVAWLNGAVRGGSDPGTFIYNHGLWDCQSDQILNDDFGGDGTVFNNTGIFRKSGGVSEFTNATVIANGVLFNQLAGSIDVQNGTNGLQLAFQGGGNLTGGFITTNTFGLTTLEAANYTINGTVTGANTWETDSGNLVGNNVVRGGLTWISGTWDSAAVTIAPATTVTMLGATGNLDMVNTIVTNNGTVAWVSGTLRGGSDPGTFVYNHGLWNAQSDQTFTAAFGGDGIVFSNYGTFSKTGTTGGSTVISGTSLFVNPGTLDTEVGNVSIQGTFTPDHGTMHFGLTSTATYGTVSISTPLAINGTLGIGLLGGFAPALGNSFTVITSTADSSQFENLNLTTLPAGDAWQVNYNPATVVLQVVTLGASDSEITGSVKDAPTHGVANVQVFAFTANNPNVYLSTTTDANGNYTLNVTNGNWTVGLSNITALGYLQVPDQMTTTSAGTPDQVVNFIVQAIGATAPVAITTTQSSVSASGATLNGTVDPDGEAVTVYFQYGTGSLNQTSTTTTLAGSLNTTQPVAIPIAGLSPVTLYQFQIVATNSIGVSFGGVLDFMTPGIAPSVVTLPATDIITTNGTVNGTVNPGGLATSYYFQYGTDTTYGSYSLTNGISAGLGVVPVLDILSNLEPGTTYHYQLVAANSIGTNVGVDLTFTNLTAPPTVVTLAATSTSTSGGTLNGSINPNGLTTLWYFEYGTDTTYGTLTTASDLPLTNVVQAVSDVLSTLNPGITYHFQLVGSNSLGTNLGGDMMFTTAGTGPAAPSATTTAESSLTSSGATLNGTVNPNGETATVYFEYGTTSLNQTTSSTILNSDLTVTQPVGIPVSGLSPNTLYQYEIVAQNGIGTTFGAVLNFTTPGATPVAVTQAATDIISTNATVNGTVNPGGLASIYYFEYGTDTNYGSYTATNPLAAGSSAVAVMELLTNLQPATVYHFQLVASNILGTNLGGDLTFTNTAAAPTVVTLAATALSADGATLNGSVNPNGLATTWYFEYGTDTNYGTLTTPTSLPPTNLVSDVSSILSTLNADTVYHFQLVATNIIGTNYGGDLTFSTVSVPAMVSCPPPITVNQATGECSQTVAFVPLVTGTPTPTLTCTLDGTPITSPFDFPVGTSVVTCTVTNLTGTNSCNFTVTVVDTNPPVAGLNSMGTYQGQAASVAVIKVLVRDSAPSGGPLSITNVTPTTPNGAAVSLADGFITYAPPSTFVGVDLITYALFDGCGTVPGNITVTVLSSNLPAKNQVSISQGPTGTTVIFAGVPGASYIVQFAPAVTGPWTSVLTGPIQAAANGLMQYTDTTTPPPASRFYRTEFVSGP